MDERTAFENYMTDGGTWPKSVVRGRDGQYLLAQTAAAWTVWQARAAQPEPAAPTEYEVAPNGRRSAVLTAMMNARTRAEAALAEPQEPDVPEVCFGNIPPVGWLESPHGEFRKNLLYKLEFPSQLLSWQIPLYAHLRAALAQPEPAAPTPYTEADCLAAEKKWSAPAAPTVVEPVAWASPSVIPLREGRNNHPCVLTDTRCAANTVPLYATPPRAALTRDEMRSIFLAHGFTIKPGYDDLKEYVYEAARAVIAASGGPRNE